MKSILAFFGVLLLYIILFLLFFSGALFLVWIMARVLMLIFAFTIFEAMLLSIFFSGFAISVIFYFSGVVDTLDENISETRRVNNRIRPISLSAAGIESLGFDRDEYAYIPNGRFYKSTSERTWEKWLSKEIANDIYAEFQRKPSTIPNLNDTQMRELAIRLADFSIDILKRKTTRARKLTITKNQLAREVQKNGQRAYDDPIIKVAVSAYNMNTDYYYDELINVVHKKKWSQLATVEDED